MLATVQQAVDATDERGEYDAILLGYARCSDGTVGLEARSIPVVIPRAHDCITLFFGSRIAHLRQFEVCTGTYYMTTGWSERDTDGECGASRPAWQTAGEMPKLGPGDSYEQLVGKYGREQAEYISQTLGDRRRNYSKLLYLRMGICEEAPFIDRARKLAADRGWQFELREGDWTLLRKLFRGQRGGDFVVLHRGSASWPATTSGSCSATRDILAAPGRDVAFAARRLVKIGPAPPNASFIDRRPSSSSIPAGGPARRTRGPLRPSRRTASVRLRSFRPRRRNRPPPRRPGPD